MLSDALSVLLPIPEHTLLLRACLWRGESGRKAGTAWLQHIRQTREKLQEDRLKSVLPLLFSALRRNRVEVDHEFLTILRAAALREELRAKTYRRICREAFSVLTGGKIPFLVLKGVVLAETAYENPALRHSHDVDILLEESDPSCAVHLLSSVGFTLSKEAVASEWQDLQLEHESGLPLVLHSRLFRIPLYNAATAEIWTRGQIQTIAEVPVRTLSPGDMLLHVCGHAASGVSRESFRWVCDAWFLIERHPDLDWEVLLEHIEHSHLALPLSVTLGYLAEELQAPIPASFLDRLHAVASQANMVEREVALCGAHASARGRFKNLLRMASNWRTRIFVLKWILFPSPAYLYLMQHLRPSWRLPFYYLARPLRYVARCLW